MARKNLSKKAESGNLRRIDSFFRMLIYILPGVLFFSYQPLIHFGSSESMNFEISLPLIWLVVFDVLVFVMLVRRRKFWKGILKHPVWLLLPVWLSASVLWSLNPLRGALTVGILWLVYLAGYGFWSLRHLFDEVGFKEKFWKVFFGSALVVCAWCWVQCVLDLVGVPREYSLMCAGCTYQMFGFPHPDGFAIEPQFMGNLLLAPIIMIGWLMLRSRPRPAGPSPRAAGANSRAAALRNAASLKHYAILLFIMVATLFLTFSRGAIYAFLVGLVVMTVWEIWRLRKWRALIVWPVVIVAFICTLCAQGIMAASSPTNDTFQGGVAKVLNHLTLGVVDVREPENQQLTEVVVVENPVENSVEIGEVKVNTDAKTNQANGAAGQEAAFDGYVAESTDTRLRLTGAAVEVWYQDFKTAMFGVGLGGAGQALYVNGLSPAPKEIIQNQYASLLLESGVVGVMLAVLTLVLIIRAMWRSPWRVILISLIVAYMISLLFFSGLPNALHIYLLSVLTLCLAEAGYIKKQDKSKTYLASGD